MVDDVLILRKLSELDEYYAQIQEFAAITVAQYAKDWKVQRIIERTLQMMIETCIDIAGHIISDQGFRIPKSYSDTFAVLQEKNILEENLYLSLRRMAQFRNIIVHQYDEVDSSVVVGILQRQMKDFIAFREAIAGYLKSLNLPKH